MNWTKHIAATISALSLVLMAQSAMAETYAITGAKLATGKAEAPIDNATVVIRDGVVVSAGTNVAIPAGATKVDAKGKWVSPGIFAAFSRLGLIEVSGVSETVDISAGSSPLSAAINVAPAFNTQGAAIAVNRSKGITRAIIAPATGRKIFAGQAALADLGADMDGITKEAVFQFVEMGEQGASEAGGSRLAAYVLFRAMLDEAKTLATSPDFSPEFITRADAPALRDVISGRTKLMVHVDRAQDILQILALKKDYPAMQIMILGASEGWMVAPQIAAAGVPVITTPLYNLPARFEQVAVTQSNIGRMKAAGVTVAIGIHDDDEAHQQSRLMQQAGNMVALNKIPGASGLSWGEAFASITSIPAQIMGFGGQYGVIAPGAKADIVLWDGDPLEVQSKAEQVWIDGVMQPMTSRQTQLRDRYRSLAPSALPQNYKR